MPGMVGAVTSMSGMIRLPSGCMPGEVVPVGGYLGRMILVCGLSTHIMHGLILVCAVFGMIIRIVHGVIHPMVFIFLFVLLGMTLHLMMFVFVHAYLSIYFPVIVLNEICYHL
jgi:hypothetical protein